jgi:hypothetical protein
MLTCGSSHGATVGLEVNASIGIEVLEEDLIAEVGETGILPDDSGIICPGQNQVVFQRSVATEAPKNFPAILFQKRGAG